MLDYMEAQQQITVETTIGTLTFDADKVRDAIDTENLAEVFRLSTDDGTPTFTIDGLTAEFHMGGVLHIQAVVSIRYEDDEEVEPSTLTMASLSPTFWNTCTGPAPLTTYLAD